MKELFVFILFLMIWGWVKGQEVPEYRIDSVKKDSSRYGKIYESDEDSVEYSASYVIPKIISNDTSYFSFIDSLINYYIGEYMNPDCGRCGTKFKVITQSKKMISLKFHNWEYSIGGNGEGVYDMAYTFDLKKQKLLLLNDIILKQYWVEIDSLINIVKGKMEVGEYKHEDSFITSSKGYYNFTIDKKGVVIYFDYGTGHDGYTSYYRLSLIKDKKYFNEYFWELINEK